MGEKRVSMRTKVNLLNKGKRQESAFDLLLGVGSVSNFQDKSMVSVAPTDLICHFLQTQGKEQVTASQD